jgi:hypothetical protein
LPSVPSCLLSEARTPTEEELAVAGTQSISSALASRQDRGCRITGEGIYEAFVGEFFMFERVHAPYDSFDVDRVVLMRSTRYSRTCSTQPRALELEPRGQVPSNGIS